MRAVIQRVSEASVRVEGKLTGAIGRGLLVLAAVARDDAENDREWLAQKIVALRIFDDDAGVMNRTILDVGGELLAVSQFTLYASTRKGNRPSWSGAAPPDIAQSAFVDFTGRLARALGRSIATGLFGADMKVALINDGPVTIVIDTRAKE